MKLLVLILFLLLSSYSVFAAKFGVVDVQKVLRNSKPALNARSKLEQKARKLDNLIKSKRKDLQNKMMKVKKFQDEFNQKAAIWRKKKRDEKRKEVLDLQRKLLRKRDQLRLFFREKKRDLEREKRKVLSRIVRTIRKISSTVAKEQKFDLVIDSSTLVLYRNSSIDLTNKVIQRYDSLK
ncbi:MAG: hypothetical protein CMH79_01680 [Nitrospinae bacterium]|nr:hypothetical protein [Nitrospinota bacterium]